MSSPRRAVWIVIALLCLMPVCMAGEDAEWYEYNVILTEWNGDRSEVFVPKWLDSKSVTMIGDNCFCGNETIETLLIPETIQVIGENAFAETGLTSAVFEGSVLHEIKGGAFSYTSLQSIVLPDRVDHLGEGIFDECDTLENVVCRKT